MIERSIITEREYNTIYNENFSYIKSFLLLKFKLDNDKLHEITHEALTKAILNIHKYNKQSNCTFKTWLTTVARNYYLDKVRSSEYKNQDVCISYTQQDNDLENYYNDLSYDMEESYIETDKIEKINSNFDKFFTNDVEKYIIKNYFLSNSTLKEMSEDIGKKEAHIKVKIQKIRNKLKNNLNLIKFD